MGARFHSWWQKNKQHVLIVGIILIAVFTAFTLAVYKFGWDWTGFGPYIPPTKDSNFQRGKTLWDLLQLAGIIAIPIAVAWFTAQQNHDFQIAQEQRKTELEISTDNQREVLLQAYLNKMSDLLLRNHLRESHPDDQVRKIAEARTLTVLPRLDGKRKGNILLFLYESGLIRRATRIIKLYGADLAEADLGGTDLSEADLSGADLSGAKLSGAKLIHADLSHAKLSKADLSIAMLSGAYLIHADLSHAKLNGADLSIAMLSEAKLIEANLSHAKLTEADLHRAYLSGADLHGAYLVHADLSFAILNGAILSEANLSYADLSYASLSEADLIGANLKEARLGEAVLIGANLGKAVGTTTKQLLNEALSLKDAIMPDGSKHA